MWYQTYLFPGLSIYSGILGAYTIMCRKTFRNSLLNKLILKYVTNV